MPAAGRRPTDRPPVEPLSLSIVLPCHDEEGNIERVAEQALQAGRSLARELEVIVVNDGSRDRTGPIADDLARRHREVRVIHHERNLGYGAAVAAGLRLARCSWVFYTDGDGQFDLDQLAMLIPLMKTNDVVSAYRLRRQDHIGRRINGWLWTRLVNLVLGMRMRDVDCAFKVFPQWFIRSIDFRSRGALISAELLGRATRMGLSIGQIGVRHLERRAGRSTGGNPRVILRAFRELLALARQIRRTEPVKHPDT